jgi:hypothetical protein
MAKKKEEQKPKELMDAMFGPLLPSIPTDYDDIWQMAEDLAKKETRQAGERIGYQFYQDCRTKHIIRMLEMWRTQPAYIEDGLLAPSKIEKESAPQKTRIPHGVVYAITAMLAALALATPSIVGNLGMYWFSVPFMGCMGFLALDKNQIWNRTDFIMKEDKEILE